MSLNPWSLDRGLTLKQLGFGTIVLQVMVVCYKHGIPALVIITAVEKDTMANPQEAKLWCDTAKTL